MPRLSEILQQSFFTEVELCAMRNDGEIYCVANVWTCSDEPLTPELKASRVARDLGANFAPSGLSALWIHGLSPEPRKHSLAMRGRVRPIDGVLETRIIRDLGHLHNKTIRVGDVECLDARTSLDEVLRDPRVSSADVQRLKTFIDEHEPQLIEACHSGLSNANRVPYTELMKSRLETILR